MNSGDPLPCEVKALDSVSLIRLEERALELDLNARLEPDWVSANVAPGATHYLWPALWNTLPHRIGLPRQLRCELLMTLRTGDRVAGLLDVVPDEFTPLPRVTSREVGLRISRLATASSPVGLRARGGPGPDTDRGTRYGNGGRPKDPAPGKIRSPPDATVPSEAGDWSHGATPSHPDRQETFVFVYELQRIRWEELVREVEAYRMARQARRARRAERRAVRRGEGRANPQADRLARAA
jgi:hypothetical protein